ncbi:ATP-dependent DNA helicase PIF1 [Prunus yedoensis var. nudiflora]|uniref:ATP-dependent DNA helicase PIF1 n=1 Tax=Prunus yedoensis var. nudiflora TaxID=2094558 RepID=A0A315A0D8_PRUYE|nr:ATP-dependent DNA helicase PIF1 [Prunus yedoensis var. nudiflora]
MTIEPITWTTNEGDSVAKREQLPLILAWASSIHKCQGMTLDCLHTDLSRAFENGMVYVALSRVRSLEGLYLSGFDPSKIKVHPKVVQFHNKFISEQDKEGEDDNGSNDNSSQEIDGRKYVRAYSK